jgi:imidazole glycerol-phosphate synthase subunit HisH
MIAIIDYGMGNLRSVQKALEKTGAKAHITHDPREIIAADKVVLPGVGAMPPARERLDDLGLSEVIKEIIADGKPFLGICLGYQLLFDLSTEGGEVKGLGVCPGRVERFTGLKVPHMGWNQLQFKNSACPLWKNVPDGANVYFCHSYYAVPADNNLVAAVTDYGKDFAAAIWDGKNLFAVQFHPEKSQVVGLQILENFRKIPS